MVYEHRFSRRGHRYGETVWSMRIDAAEGTVRIIERKSMKRESSICSWVPESFMASGNRREHRVARGLMRKSDLSFMKRGSVDENGKPLGQQGEG